MGISFEFRMLKTGVPNMDFSKMLHKFTVVPSLTEDLAPLQRIAYNLWWSWEQDAISLFRRLDAELWKTTRHNPVDPGDPEE
jgi:starch phosphorylase